ncbi:hypothetical protein [Aureivirga sp. CE67]|uniref:hypothetical protein n=1 Tax=Aureivirga sp. CE67 TaxID=1788983 RepID=UPI0018C98752|nr:hypothetical protein [Aureivirga sp. CE67]
MKIKNTKLLLLPVFVLTLMSFAIQEDWYTFKSKKLNFQIEFPGKPAEEKENVVEGPMNIEMVALSYEAESEDAEIWVYQTLYSEYPKKFAKEVSQDVFFKGMIDGAKKELGGEILSQKEISYEGYPGRDIKFSFMDGLGVFSMRVYLIENEMYTMQVISSGENQDSKLKDKFFDSFKLLKK